MRLHFSFIMKDMKRSRIWIILAAAAAVMVLLGFRPSSSRLPDAYGTMETEESTVLQKALAYTETRPIYRSRYYVGGYPNDMYGTCVDVVGIALRDAGYDRREKVNEDVRAHPERYDIEHPDIDIDFRRVRNLIVFFENNAEVLTSDVSEIESWKAGDIVIFRNHIGIVSDHRNARGIPYVIHHYSRWQLRYEEDILGTRDDIVMHVRVSV